MALFGVLFDQQEDRFENGLAFTNEEEGVFSCRKEKADLPE
jgi:hypothetical protein